MWTWCWFIASVCRLPERGEEAGDFVAIFHMRTKPSVSLSRSKPAAWAAARIWSSLWCSGLNPLGDRVLHPQAPPKRRTRPSPANPHFDPFHHRFQIAEIDQRVAGDREVRKGRYHARERRSIRHLEPVIDVPRAGFSTISGDRSTPVRVSRPALQHQAGKAGATQPRSRMRRSFASPSTPSSSSSRRWGTSLAQRVHHVAFIESGEFLVELLDAFVGHAGGRGLIAQGGENMAHLGVLGMGREIFFVADARAPTAGRRYARVPPSNTGLPRRPGPVRPCAWRRDRRAGSCRIPANAPPAGQAFCIHHLAGSLSAVAHQRPAATAPSIHLSISPVLVFRHEGRGQRADFGHAARSVAQFGDQGRNGWRREAGPWPRHRRYSRFQRVTAGRRD